MCVSERMYVRALVEYYVHLKQNKTLKTYNSSYRKFGRCGAMIKYTTKTGKDASFCVNMWMGGGVVE